MLFFAVARKFVDQGYLKVDPKLSKKLKLNNWVEVETELGRLAFRLIQVVKKPTKEQQEQVIGTIVGELTKERIEEIEGFSDQEKEMLKVFSEQAKKYDLPMKPIEAVKAVDDSRIVFYFTAPKRVDFRRLVKDLAVTFRKLIRLQQINQRVATMIKGGLGPCGRPICCQSSMKLDLKRGVGAEMMEGQGLQGVDTSKLSGACGKLVCCLAFEKEQYQEMMEDMPKLGKKIKVKEEGLAEVIDINPLKRTVLVKFSNGKTKEVKIKEKK